MLNYGYSEKDKCYVVYLDGKPVKRITCPDMYETIVKTAKSKETAGENEVLSRTNHMHNIRVFTISNKYTQYSITVPLSAKDELEKVELALKKMRIAQCNIKYVNKRKLKKSVKIAGAILVTVPLGTLAYQNIANPEPDFSIPQPAEMVNDDLTNHMEFNNLDPTNEAARNATAQQLYSTDPIEERHYKLDMDDVAVEITQAKNDYNEGKLSKKEAREILSEIRDFYKESSEMYDEYKAEQNNSKSL